MPATTNQPEAAAPEPKARASSAKPDLATIGGLLLACVGILGGLLIEGGKMSDITQPTAAMIVLGGTIGAVMVSTPLAILLSAAKRLASVFINKERDAAGVADEIIAYSTQARKNGLVSLEQQAENIEDPFLRKALNLAIDGTDLQDIQKMLELEVAATEAAGEAEAKVFEAAGGYAPTVGIIGAVLGLIQVMKHLANIDEVGRGIAVSFVATVYGVGVANLFFLPAATKIRARCKATVQIQELIIEGITGIVEGLNPKLIRIKLDAFCTRPSGSKKKEVAANAPSPATTQA